MVPVCEAALGAGDPPLLCIWPSSAVSDCIACIGSPDRIARSAAGESTTTASAAANAASVLRRYHKGSLRTTVCICALTSSIMRSASPGGGSSMASRISHQS